LQQSNVGGVTHETKRQRNIVTNAKAKSGLGTRLWEKSEKGSGRYAQVEVYRAPRMQALYV